MELKQMKAFVAAARNLNFSRAAEELFMTQPSISKAVKALEEELGALLFERTPAMRLTDIGQEMYNRCVQIIGLTDSIPDEISRIGDTPSGEIKIGIPPIIGASFFPRIIGEFRREYPSIKLKLYESGSKSIIKQMDEGKLDVGIVCSYPDKREEYQIREFINSPLMVVSNIENPLSFRKILTFEDLRDENFILFQEDFSLYDIIISRCSDCGYHPNLVCNSSQRDFILEMTKADLGITLLPNIITKTIKDDSLKVTPMKEPGIFLNLLMLWKSNSYQSRSMNEWIKFVGSSMTKK